MAEQLYATLKTNHGDIEVRLLPNHAPKTVRNFVELAQGEREWTHPGTGEKSTKRLYDGTIFHRVISGFMIQGGDPLGTGIGGPGYEFEDEFHPDLGFNKPYLLAMANAGPGTNGSQFFITVSPTAWLNRKHTIFGEITDAASQKVVDAIMRRQDHPPQRPTGERRRHRAGRRGDPPGLSPGRPPRREPNAPLNRKDERGGACGYDDSGRLRGWHESGGGQHTGGPEPAWLLPAPGP